MTQLVWNGLFVGSFYALVALGYSMVYGIIKLLNFAHGDLYMLGAFVGFAILGAVGGVSPSMALPLLLVVLLATMVVTGLAGVALERIAYRPLRRAPRLSLLITAVGASFALEYGMRAVAGADPQVYPVRLGGTAMEVLGARLTLQQLVLMGVAVVLMIALNLLVTRTREGRAMRAIALDPRTSALMGINVNSVISRTFFVGSALAGAAGVMAGAYYGKIDFMMGFLIGLKAFTAAVIGGIGNIPGTMLGGLLLGLLESFGTYWLGGEWRDVFAFGVLILFLTVRPTGLLGERVTERV
ncbi:MULTISPECIES: branched-chain amino acid ABC transporter permease [Streptosporangium]|uniref:Branched-chain amino acid transport system permease protein n=1 Tax=Streptosporangium subroseum TaxID=106412 RepID=A0A239LEG8_9ACTN|nr:MULTISPECIES: branched-chain amino acid ABC transporter permease [Streptosporangium]AWS42444.1 branched-chain amino acid ABC transporter permease [Streptosporangium sp. 'caverna']SNT28700.1 branched-chain amino acid transport system permease protein [Streptosporangium subroseum]